MPEYRRAFEPGGTFFFTVVTQARRPILRDERGVKQLGHAFRIVKQRHPFNLVAWAILPDHLHCIWTLPHGDGDFAMRWRLVKRYFTQGFLAAGGSEVTPSESRARRKERGVWQRRFWEHVVRNEREFEALCSYIHYNPVKHGLSQCPHAWPHSSFQRFVDNGRYAPTWNCICDGRPRGALDYAGIEAFVGE